MDWPNRNNNENIYFDYFYGICPKCNKIGRENGMFYSILDCNGEKPLLECENGHTFILNIRQYYLIKDFLQYEIKNDNIKDINDPLFDKIKEFIKNQTSCCLINDYIILKIPLLKVTRIIRSILINYEIKNNKKEKINDNLILDFLDSYYKNSNVNEQFLIEHDLSKIEHYWEQPSNFNFSLPCNSYDINEPEIPYPKLFNDGKSFVKLELENGESVHYLIEK